MKKDVGGGTTPKTTQASQVQECWYAHRAGMMGENNIHPPLHSYIFFHATCSYCGTNPSTYHNSYDNLFQHVHLDPQVSCCMH